VTSAIALVLALAQQDVDLEPLVRRLGSDELEERQRAEEALEKAGAAARPALERATRSEDPEVAARANAILLRIRARAFARPVLEKVDNPLARFGRADHFQVTPDRKLAVGADLETLSIWTVPEGKLVRRFRPHQGDLRTVVLSPDGSRLLTVGDSFSEMSVWEFPSLRRLRVFDSTRRRPASIAASPDGRHVALAVDKGVWWVQAETGTVVWRWSAEGTFTARSVDVSSDGTRVAVIGANSPRVFLLDASTGDPLGSTEARSTGFRSRVRFSADGKSLFITNPDSGEAGQCAVTDGKPGKLEKFEDPSGLADPTARFAVVGDARAPVPQGKIRIVAEGFHPLLGEVASTPGDQFVLVHLRYGKPIARYSAADGSKLGEIGGRAKAFAVSGRGALVGTIDGEVVLYDFEGNELDRYSHGKTEVDLVGFAGADRVLSLGNDHVLRCRDLRGAREAWRREFLPFNFYTHRLTPDNRHIVGHLEPGGGEPYFVARWSVETGGEVRRYLGHKGYTAGIAISPDGGLLAASTRDGPLAAWDAATARTLWERRPGKNSRWLAFTPQGKSLFAGDDEGRLARYEAGTGAIERVYRESGPRILGGAVSEDGSQVAVIGDAAGPQIYDIATGKLTRELPGPGYNGIAFVGGGKEVLYASPLTLASLETGEVLAVHPFVWVRAVQIDSTRRRLAALFSDMRFVVVDLESGRKLWELRLPREYSGFVLGPEARRVLFHDDSGSVAGATLGATKVEAERRNIWIKGADPERGRVFAGGGAGIQIRDISTLDVVEEAALPAVEWISVPPGSTSAWVRVGGKLGHLDRDLRTAPRSLDVPWTGRDLDQSGSLILVGTKLYDTSGRLLAEVSLPADLCQALWGTRWARAPQRPQAFTAGPMVNFSFFFGSDGQRLYGVNPEGMVVWLRPGP